MIQERFTKGWKAFGLNSPFSNRECQEKSSYIGSFLRDSEIISI